MMKRPSQEGVLHGGTLSDRAAELTRELERLKEERDFLLVHSRNLEVELRGVALQRGRIRQLEDRLADAEARLRRVSVIHAARWLVLNPNGAFRRIYRRLREGAGWRMRRGYRDLRLKLRRFGA